MNRHTAAILAAALALVPIPQAGAVMNLQERGAKLYDASAAERSRAAWDIGNMGLQNPLAHDYLPRLIELLQDGDAAVRENSADAISKLKNIRSAVPALTQALRDPDYRTRNRAVHALSRAGADAEPAVPEIASLLNADPEQIVRVEAACTMKELGPIAGAAAPALLAAALHDEDALVRSSSVDAMLSIDPADKTVTNSLRKAMSNPDATVQRNAARDIIMVEEIKAEKNRPKSIFR